MKLTTKGQYAVKAMLNLAINFNSRPVKLTEISSSQTISLSYLEQLFSMLRNSGLVQGVRGPGGGYRLGKVPNHISIADIILAIKEPTNSASSKRDLNSNKSEDSLANHLWNEISEQLLAYLGSISLADIIKDQIVIKNQYQLDETTRRISTMFPVSAKLMVA